MVLSTTARVALKTDKDCATKHTECALLLFGLCSWMNLSFCMVQQQCEKAHCILRNELHILLFFFSARYTESQQYPTPIVVDILGL